MNKEQERQNYVRKLKNILGRGILTTSINLTPQHRIFKMLSYETLLKIIFDNECYIEDTLTNEKIYIDFSSIYKVSKWWKSHYFKKTKIKMELPSKDTRIKYIVKDDTFVGIHEVTYEEIKNMDCSKEEKLSWTKEWCPEHYKIIIELKRLKNEMAVNQG